MKSLFKNIVWIFLAVLIIANTYVYVSGIKLGSNINFFEREIEKIHEQNIELDKKNSYLDSYQYAASTSASFEFVKKSVPIQLNNLRYALNR